MEHFKVRLYEKGDFAKAYIRLRPEQVPEVSESISQDSSDSIIDNKLFESAAWVAECDDKILYIINTVPMNNGLLDNNSSMLFFANGFFTIDAQNYKSQVLRSIKNIILDSFIKPLGMNLITCVNKDFKQGLKFLKHFGFKVISESVDVKIKSDGSVSVYPSGFGRFSLMYRERDKEV